MKKWLITRILRLSCQCLCARQQARSLVKRWGRTLDELAEANLEIARLKTELEHLKTSNAPYSNPGNPTPGNRLTGREIA